MRVVDKVDIVEIVSARIPLTKKGKEYICLCPFHNDNKPSLCIIPHKQIYYCFACQNGGNAIKFIMEHDNLSFKDAIKEVAEIAGIELNYYQDDARRDIDYKLIDRYLDYLAHRIQTNSNIFSTSMLSNDYSLNELCGLINDKGITIEGLAAPVFNLRNKIIGFYSKFGIAKSINYSIDSYVGRLTNNITDRFDDVFNGMTMITDLNKNISNSLALNFNAVTFHSSNNKNMLFAALRNKTDINMTYYDFYNGRLQNMDSVLNDCTDNEIKTITSTMPDSTLKDLIISDYNPVSILASKSLILSS